MKSSLHCYSIWKFNVDGSSSFVKDGLTEQQAKDHCNGPSTHGDGWFHGYRLTKPKPKSDRSLTGMISALFKHGKPVPSKRVPAHLLRHAEAQDQGHFRH